MRAGGGGAQHVTGIAGSCHPKGRAAPGEPCTPPVRSAWATPPCSPPSGVGWGGWEVQLRLLWRWDAWPAGVSRACRIGRSRGGGGRPGPLPGASSGCARRDAPSPARPREVHRATSARSPGQLLHHRRGVHSRVSRTLGRSPGGTRRSFSPNRWARTQLHCRGILGETPLSLSLSFPTCRIVSPMVVKGLPGVGAQEEGLPLSTALAGSISGSEATLPQETRRMQCTGRPHTHPGTCTPTANTGASLHVI